MKRLLTFVLSICLMCMLITESVPAEEKSGRGEKETKYGLCSTDYEDKITHKLHFNLFLQYLGIHEYDIYIDGVSHTRYWGHDPYNADKIVHTDYADWSAVVGTSATISSPPGVSMDYGTGYATWTYEHDDTWQVTSNHNYRVYGVKTFALQSSTIKYHTESTVRINSVNYSFVSDRSSYWF